MDISKDRMEVSKRINKQNYMNIHNKEYRANILVRWMAPTSQKIKAIKQWPFQRRNSG